MMHGKTGNIGKLLIYWAGILAALVVFFPIGIGLMILMLFRDKEHLTINGLLVMVFGWLAEFFGAVFLIVGFTEFGPADIAHFIVAVVMAAVCFAGGSWLIRNGKKYRKVGKLYDQYLPIIQNCSDGSLEWIADYTSEPYDEMCNNLKVMVDMGLFPGSYLDLQRGIFVSPWVKKENLEEHTVECTNCGAVNTIRGKAGKCEYCGSPLEDK